MTGLFPGTLIKFINRLSDPRPGLIPPPPIQVMENYKCIEVSTTRRRAVTKRSSRFISNPITHLSVDGNEPTDASYERNSGEKRYYRQLCLIRPHLFGFAQCGKSKNFVITSKYTPTIERVQ